jgi:hypothetical protein
MFRSDDERRAFWHGVLANLLAFVIVALVFGGAVRRR